MCGTSHLGKMTGVRFLQIAKSMVQLNAILTNQLFLLFLITSTGYVVGRVKIRGIGLGSAGILIIALVFGHFGYEVPSIVQNIGLACFVAAVGFNAGPTFVQNCKGKAKNYAVIGTVIVVSGVLTCLAVIVFTDIGPDLSLGLLAGALTTTPGLAAGIEATGSDLVSVGYGIAYPFGVTSVVLFVQALPRLLHVDIEAEKKALKVTLQEERPVMPENLIQFDSYGLFSFSIAIATGFLIGQIRIPVPGGGVFSLGTSGGPLLAGLVLGHFQNVGIFDARVKGGTLVTMRELGLAFFLAGAGTHAGSGFVQILVQRGWVLFLYGALMTSIPLAAGLTVARKVYRMNILDAMGSICGGMTSTPALGTLIDSTGTDDVAHSYAATYPIALALIVILIELIGGKLVLYI